MSIYGPWKFEITRVFLHCFIAYFQENLPQDWLFLNTISYLHNLQNIALTKAAYSPMNCCRSVGLHAYHIFLCNFTGVRTTVHIFMTSILL